MVINARDVVADDEVAVEQVVAVLVLVIISCNILVILHVFSHYLRSDTDNKTKLDWQTS